MFLTLLTIWEHLTPDRIKIIGATPKEVPLKSIDLKANVYGSKASIDFTLKYKNEKNSTLVESRFVFPINSDMALYDVVLS